MYKCWWAAVILGFTGGNFWVTEASPPMLYRGEVRGSSFMKTIKALPFAFGLQLRNPKNRDAMSFSRLSSSSSSLSLCLRSISDSMMKSPTLHQTSLQFDFHGVPYAAGLRHIHSPEHIAEIHRFGAPFFRIDSVEKPKLGTNQSIMQSDGKTRKSITFTCSSLLLSDMRVRMFTFQPNTSNLVFFKDSRALFGVKFSVVPIQQFTSHRLFLEIKFFAGSPTFKAAVQSLMPIFLFLNGLEDTLAFQQQQYADHKNDSNDLSPSTNACDDSDMLKSSLSSSSSVLEHDNVFSYFSQYRLAVLSPYNKALDEYWVMSQDVIQQYGGKAI